MSGALTFTPKGSQFTPEERKMYLPVVPELFCLADKVDEEVMVPLCALNYLDYLERSTVGALMGWRVSTDPCKFGDTADRCRVRNLIGEAFPCLTEQFSSENEVGDAVIKPNKMNTIYKDKTPVIAGLKLTEHGRSLMQSLESERPGWLADVKRSSQGIANKTTVEEPRAKRPRPSRSSKPTIVTNDPDSDSPVPVQGAPDELVRSNAAAAVWSNLRSMEDEIAMLREENAGLKARVNTGKIVGIKGLHKEVGDLMKIVKSLERSQADRFDSIEKSLDALRREDNENAGEDGDGDEY
jgi:hypothetical protein